jgi:hypothetical protein
MCVLTLTVLIAQVVILGLGVAVDPYGVLHNTHIAGVNKKLPRLMSGGGRLVKSLTILTREFDAVVVGSSRVRIGFNPNSHRLKNEGLYNLGLDGMDLVELDAVVRYAMSRQNLKKLIIGLDFYAFSRNATPGGDFINSCFSGQPAYLAFAERIFSASSAESVGRFGLG